MSVPNNKSFTNICQTSWAAWPRFPQNHQIWAADSHLGSPKMFQDLGPMYFQIRVHSFGQPKSFPELNNRYFFSHFFFGGGQRLFSRNLEPVNNFHA